MLTLTLTSAYIRFSSGMLSSDTLKTCCIYRFSRGYEGYSACLYWTDVRIVKPADRRLLDATREGSWPERSTIVLEPGYPMRRTRGDGKVGILNLTEHRDLNHHCQSGGYVLNETNAPREALPNAKADERSKGMTDCPCPSLKYFRS